MLPGNLNVEAVDRTITILEGIKNEISRKDDSLRSHKGAIEVGMAFSFHMVDRLEEHDYTVVTEITVEPDDHVVITHAGRLMGKSHSSLSFFRERATLVS